MSDPVTPETPAAPISMEDAHAALTDFDVDTKTVFAERNAARPKDPEAAYAWDRASNDIAVDRQRQRLDLVRAYHRAKDAADGHKA